MIVFNSLERLKLENFQDKRSKLDKNGPNAHRLENATSSCKMYTFVVCEYHRRLVTESTLYDTRERESFRPLLDRASSLCHFLRAIFHHANQPVGQNGIILSKTTPMTFLRLLAG